MKFSGDLNHPATLHQGLEGASRVVHLAIQPLRPGNDLQMAGAIMGALQEHPVEHCVYMSISGPEHMRTAPYDREKMQIERRFGASGLPITVQRSTQFHEFVLEKLTLGPLKLVPKGVTLFKQMWLYGSLWGG